MLDISKRKIKIFSNFYGEISSSWSSAFSTVIFYYFQLVLRIFETFLLAFSSFLLIDPPRKRRPCPLELLRKIQELEAEHARLKRMLSRLPAAFAAPPRRREGGASKYIGNSPPLTDELCLNILQSMGQSVHILDPNQSPSYLGLFGGKNRI